MKKLNDKLSSSLIPLLGIWVGLLVLAAFFNLRFIFAISPLIGLVLLVFVIVLTFNQTKKKETETKDKENE